MSVVAAAEMPWVEKYRPSKFEDVILSQTNRRMFERIVLTDNFPNLIFYGPPGVGKTTTIMALIRRFHELRDQKHSALTLHLNASDERGMDVIHNQIEHFVRTQQLFYRGVKFVILDEVDYMTQEAQQALCALIRSVPHSAVRFCLIGNYIGKIYQGLQTDFIKIRFHTLPVSLILSFLRNICDAENMGDVVSDAVLQNIQQRFHSDVRSMINTLQMYSPSTIANNFCDIPYDKLTNFLIQSSVYEITGLATELNMNVVQLLREWTAYIIWKERNNPRLLRFIEFTDKWFHSTIFEHDGGGNKTVFFIKKMCSDATTLLVTH